MVQLEQCIRDNFGINTNRFSEVVDFFQLESVAKGEYFVREGNYCQKLSFIKSGFLRTYTYHNTKEITQWISGTDQFITDLSSLLFHTPAKMNIQAISESTLFTISRKNYEKIGHVVPEWNHLEKLFIAKCFNILEDRVFSFLSMTAEERFHHFFKQNSELFNEVPLHYISSLLGMTPETLSRIRKKLIS